MDDRAFIAAAVDFSDAGPSQFHPGFEQYRDLALVAQRIATPSAPRPDAGEVERLRAVKEVLQRYGLGVASDCGLARDLCAALAALRTPAAGVEGDAPSTPAGMVAYGPEHPDYPNAPKDWNGGRVMLADDTVFHPYQSDEPFDWQHDYSETGCLEPGCIVAYTSKAQPAPAVEEVERLREAGK